MNGVKFPTEAAALARPPNECGECKLCCKLLGVPEVTMPNEWCPNCNVKGTGKGCTIYDTRPKQCRDFECGWLANQGDPELRPDRIHIVVTGESQRLDAYIIHVDPAYPDAPERPVAKTFLEMVMQQGRHKNIVLVTGGRRRVIGKNMAVVLRELEKIDAETH